MTDFVLIAVVMALFLFIKFFQGKKSSSTLSETIDG